MAVSFNFGEVLSVLIASVLLPFFPITPIQLLVQSLIYDMGQLSIPYDNVDKEYLEKPRVWNMKSLKRFMLYMGPTSSIFDLIDICHIMVWIWVKTSRCSIISINMVFIWSGIKPSRVAYNKNWENTIFAKQCIKSSICYVNRSKYYSDIDTFHFYRKIYRASSNTTSIF